MAYRRTSRNGQEKSPTSLTSDNQLGKHLNLIKSGEENTSLELASEGNGARISGDLDVTGYTDNIKLREEATIKADGNVILDIQDISLPEDLTLDSSDDLTINADDVTVNADEFNLVSDTPLLRIQAEVDSASDGRISFVKKRGGVTSAGQDDDYLGKISWVGYNDTPSQATYVLIRAQQLDATSGDSRGSLRFDVMTNDSSLGNNTHTGLLISGSTTDDEVDVNIGAGTSSITTIAGVLDIDGDKITNNLGGGFTIDTFSTLTLDSGAGLFKFLDAGDPDDYFKITVVGGTGATTLETVSAGNDGHLILDADGDLTLDSNSGNFIAKKIGTEFSAANSAYAGMILGYTCLLNDAADTSYAVTNAFVTVDATTKITFVSPPSGNVEIFVGVHDDPSTQRPLYFGLSDNATYNTLDVTHEHEVHQANNSDEQMINHRWVITGLTSGTSYTYWLGAKSSHSSVHVLRWGGDATSEYAPFIMKAIALPATIYDGT